MFGATKKELIHSLGRPRSQGNQLIATPHPTAHAGLKGLATRTPPIR